MSVPKIRRIPLPQHVSDRLRRAKNCSNERNTHLENSTENDAKTVESVTRTHVTKRPINPDDLHKLGGPKNLHVEKSVELPERVRKGERRRSSISNNRENDLNMEVFFMEVLKELKQDVKKLDGVHAHVPCSGNIILRIINDCFRRTDDSGEYSSVLDNWEELFQYAKRLTGECIEIIERIIHQQPKLVFNINDSSDRSARKKKKTLLLNTILGIEHGLINSEKLLELVNKEWHSQSFRFIYCLLKYFMTKTASRLKLSGNPDLEAQSRVNSRDERFVVSNLCVQADSEPVPDHMVEDCSNRLDKLLQQWAPSGDSCHEVESSQQVVTDCYRDGILKRVSHYTEEIKRKLFDCHHSGVGTQSRDDDPKDDIQEEPKMEERSDVTACGTEVSAFYSWSLTGHGLSHRDSSRNRSQYSDCHRPRPSVHQNQNNCQTCSSKSCSSRNYQGLTPVMAHSRGQRLTDYYSTYQPMAQNSNRYCTSTVVADGSYNRKPPPIPNGNTYQHPSMNSCTNNFSITQPLTDSRNTHCITSPMTLQPFPKLQLPNFNTTCNVEGTQGFSHTPPCISPTGRMNKLCTPGNQLLDGNCGKCLVICENNPKPPYYHKFPGFKDNGFYGTHCVNTFQPHLFDAFSVSPEYGDENPSEAKTKERKSTASEKDKKSVAPDKAKKSMASEKERKIFSSEKERKGELEKKRESSTFQNERKTASPEEERESPTSEKGRKGMTSEKERKNVTSKEKGRKSLSPYIDDNVQQTNEQEMSPSSRIDKRQERNAKKEETPKPLSLDKNVSPPEIGSQSKKSKESGANNGGTTTTENQSGETPPPRLQSRANVGKASTSYGEGLRRNDSAKVEENGGKESLENKSSKTVKSKSDTGGQQVDDHCTCCKCKTNSENDNSVPMFVSPCHCNGMNNQDPTGCPSRAIFQFFATPMPVACNCRNKSITKKSPSQVQKTDSKHPESPPSSESRKKRDSQDVETQTGKKPNSKSDTNFSEPFTPEPSAGQIAPVQSNNDHEPCIENSESCTVIYSQSSSHHRGDAKSDSKHSEKCPCPRDIEGIFQEFDDKYSKCVQEIKLLIREGYIPRFEGSDESFTLTHEIRITPSRSKSGCKDDQSKSSPKQQLRFQKSQDQMKSDDSYAPVGSRDNYPNRSNLREDIEELKRLVKNSKIGCPCCKCCKCEKEGKVTEECTNCNDTTFGKDLKKQSDQAKPGLIQSESSENRRKPPKRYTSKEIDESNKEPPKGVKVIHLSQSFVEPELPPSVQELITPPESKATKTSSSEKYNIRQSSKGDPKNPERKGVNNQSKTDSKQVLGNSSKPEIVAKTPDKPQRPFVASRSLQPQRQLELVDVPPTKGGYTQSEVTLDNVPVNKRENVGSPRLQEGMSAPSQDNSFGVTTISLDDGKLSAISNETQGNSEITVGESSSVEFGSNQSNNSRKNTDERRMLDTENEYTGVKQDTKRKRGGLRWQDGLEADDDKSEDIVGDSKFQLDQSAGNERGTPGQKRLLEQPIGTEPGGVVHDGKSAAEKEHQTKTLEYDDKAEKLLEKSLEKEALNQSRENLFGKLKDSVAPPKDDEVKKSWNPFNSIFGVFGEKTVEEGTSKRERQFDDRTSKSGGKVDDGQSKSGGKFDARTSDREGKLGDEKLYDGTSKEGGKFDDSTSDSDGKFDVGTPKRHRKSDGSTPKSDGKIDDVKSKEGRKYDDDTSEGRVDGENSKRKDGNIDDLPKLIDPCGDDDDDVSFSSSCAAVNPCWSSSCSTIDECRELFDSIPCDFHSEESITEVIKATETELYVMIIESDPPVAQPSVHHDKIISMLLSGSNNVDVMGYGNTDSSRLRNISRNHVPLRNAGSKSYTKRIHQTVQPQYPVGISSLQRSYDSSSGIESSDEEQSLSITKNNSPTSQNIKQEMKERKSSSHSKREEKLLPKPSRDRQSEKKNPPGHNARKNSGDVAVPKVESVIITEKDKSKKTDDKEVQVTKWNAKVQTAGPRKFNRTDIPKDVEDKLATYLGLERTAEQMDLKITAMEEQTPAQRDSGVGNLKHNKSKRESKRPFEKNIRNNLKN